MSQKLRTPSSPHGEGRRSQLNSISHGKGVHTSGEQERAVQTERYNVDSSRVALKCVDQFKLWVPRALGLGRRVDARTERTSGVMPLRFNMSEGECKMRNLLSERRLTFYG